MIAVILECIERNSMTTAPVIYVASPRPLLTDQRDGESDEKYQKRIKEAKEFIEKSIARLQSVMFTQRSVSQYGTMWCDWPELDEKAYGLWYKEIYEWYQEAVEHPAWKNRRSINAQVLLNKIQDGQLPNEAELDKYLGDLADIAPGAYREILEYQTSLKKLKLLKESA